MVVTPFHDARFVPVDPTRPEGSHLAVPSGDPTNGPSAMLLRLKKGSGPLHVHSADYHLVVLEGTMKHWSPEERESDVRPLGPRSYWFQPGQQAHGDACLTDQCLMFVTWADARDSRLAGTARE